MKKATNLLDKVIAQGNREIAKYEKEKREREERIRLADEHIEKVRLGKNGN